MRNHSCQIPDRWGFRVGPASLLTGWDTALLMAPFGALLAAWMFGLDELLTAPRARRRRAFSLTNLNGREALTDPDGRPWKGAAGAGNRRSGRSRQWKSLQRGESHIPEGRTDFDLNADYATR